MSPGIGDLYGKAKAPPEAETKMANPGKGPVVPEFPPGLPQQYVDTVLTAREVEDVTAKAEEVRPEPPLNFSSVAHPTMRHVEHLPYQPGSVSGVVQDRIAQGPHPTPAIQTDPLAAVNHGKADNPMAHPDTNKPGRVVRGEPGAYRPGVG